MQGNSKHLSIPMSSNKSKHGEPPKVKLNLSESKQWQLQFENVSILSVIWQEKQKPAPVRMLSSNTDLSLPLSSVKRKQRGGTLKEVPYPLPVVTYNKFMNGVDRSDQNPNKVCHCTLLKKVVDIFVLVSSGHVYFKCSYFI